MKLHSLLAEDLVILDMESSFRDAALKELVVSLKRARKITKDKELYEKLLQRETLGSTAVGDGFAIPHGKHKGIKSPLVLVAVSPKGVEFGAPDGKPVHVFFFVVSHPDNPSLNLQILAAVAQLLRRSPSLLKHLVQARTARKVMDVIRQEENGPQNG